MHCFCVPSSACLLFLPASPPPLLTCLSLSFSPSKASSFSSLHLIRPFFFLSTVLFSFLVSCNLKNNLKVYPLNPFLRFTFLLSPSVFSLLLPLIPHLILSLFYSLSFSYSLSNPCLHSSLTPLFLCHSLLSPLTLDFPWFPSVAFPPLLTTIFFISWCSLAWLPVYHSPASALWAL